MSGSAIATARHAEAAVCLRQNNEPYQKENCLSKALPGRPHEASRNEKCCLSHRPVLRRPENKKQCPRCPVLVTPNTNLYIVYGIPWDTMFMNAVMSLSICQISVIAPTSLMQTLKSTQSCTGQWPKITRCIMLLLIITYLFWDPLSSDGCCPSGVPHASQLCSL